MTEDEIRDLIGGLDGVRVLVVSERDGAPPAAWGDTFCYYDPDATGDQKLPFATIVTHDYEGWDEVSDLDRPGAFRLNLAVGRAHQPSVDGEIDHRRDDVVLPHPHYAAQGWVAIVNPSDASADRVRELVTLAHERAVARHR